MIHNRETELRKRFALQDELRELARPLFDDLPPAERQAIAETVRDGIIRQSVWPIRGGRAQA